MSVNDRKKPSNFVKLLVLQAAGMFLMLFPPLVAGARQKVATPGAASGAGAWAAGQHQHEAADQGWKPQWSIA